MRTLDLRLSHIRKSYQRPVLTDVNLWITNASYTAILGRSGSGKSTLLNILGLVEAFDGGSYTLYGKRVRPGADDARLRRETIGFIFQSYHLIPTLTCLENIRLPLLYGRRRAPKQFDEWVDRLAIGPLLDQRVTTLSGGEKQCVAALRALMLDPCLLLADEPTGNLDPVNRCVIMDLLREEHRRGRAVLLITHDEQAAAEANEILLLQNGTLHPAAQGAAKDA